MSQRDVQMSQALAIGKSFLSQIEFYCQRQFRGTGHL